MSRIDGPHVVVDRTRPPGSGSRSGSAWWFRRLLGLAALVLAAFPGMAVFAGLAGADPSLAASEGYEQSFRGGPQEPPDWQRFGPGAEEEVQFEPNGLRITLPAGSPKTTGTGVRSTFGVKGDFEITVTFEILQESAPAVPNKKTRFTLAALLDRPGFNMATIARAVGQKGEINALPKPRSEFHTWVTLWNESTGNSKERFNRFPTEARIGRLRLVRSGSTLTFHAAEGRDGEFVLLQKYPFGDEDLKDVRLAAATDDSRRGSLDVRVSDLRIRATNLQPDSAPASEPGHKSGSKKWLAALAIMGLLAVSILVVCLVVRRRRRRDNSLSPAPVLEGEVEAITVAPPISLRCSGCEKTLKVKAEMAGKKIKCPQCGKAVAVHAPS